MIPQALPIFLADDKERATTRYVNITTVAIFFSSVSASILPLFGPVDDTAFFNAEQFFLFQSLIFSVSSAISSLLGMTWRKSSM